MEKLRKRQFTFSTWYILLAFAIFWGVNAYLAHESAPRRIPYSELISLVESGKVKEANIRSDEIVAVVKGAKSGDPDQTLVATRLPNIDESPLPERMRAKGVVVWG